MLNFLVRNSQVPFSASLKGFTSTNYTAHKTGRPAAEGLLSLLVQLQKLQEHLSEMSLPEHEVPLTEDASSHSSSQSIAALLTLRAVFHYRGQT